MAQTNFTKEVPGVLLEKPIFHIIEKLQIKIRRDAHSSRYFLLNTLKGTAITLPADILCYSTLSGTNCKVEPLKGTTSIFIIFIGETPRCRKEGEDGAGGRESNASMKFNPCTPYIG